MCCPPAGFSLAEPDSDGELKQNAGCDPVNLNLKRDSPSVRVGGTSPGAGLKPPVCRAAATQYRELEDFDSESDRAPAGDRPGTQTVPVSDMYDMNHDAGRPGVTVQVLGCQ
jgi:hypothetical protein